MSLFDRHPFTRHNAPPRYALVYVLSLLFSFHVVLVAHTNSTYMEKFITPEVIGVLFGLGSALAVLSFLFISRVLRKLGNVKLILWLAVLEILALLFMATALSPSLVVVAYVAFLTINPLIYLCIDIFSETLIGDDESSTGSKRGVALTLMSLMSVLAALAVGFIVGDNEGNLNRTYFYSAGVFSLFALLIVIHFNTFRDPRYHELKVLRAIHAYWQERDMRFVLLAQFTLQVFFAWTNIYLPLYLATEIGLGWNLLAPIIAIGLSAYVFLEYPVGYIADRYLGEKEMMAVGFLILAIGIASIAFVSSTAFIVWAALMFLLRTGASLVEATAESYFFKHTKGSDANIMSFFRITRPLGFLFGALLGSVSLLFLPFNLIFIILAFVMSLGILFTTELHDTR